jgi:uncharacterized protein involved in cysteine biosynthesis
MKIFSAIWAIPFGLQVCLFDPTIRKLCIKPWIIATISYLLFAGLAYATYSPILNLLVTEPTGFLATLWFYFIGAVLIFFLLACVILLSFVAVMIFASVYQIEIASKILAENGLEVAINNQGVIKQTGKTALIEMGKLLWLLPLGFLILLLSFSTILTPVALILGAWVLAYEFTDVSLEALGLNFRKRLSFASKNFLPLSIFGLVLTMIWLIPFAGILMIPVATAASAKLVGSLKGISEN